MRNSDVVEVAAQLSCSVNQAIYLLMLTRGNVETAVKLFRDEGLERQICDTRQLELLREHPDGELELASSSSGVAHATPLCYRPVYTEFRFGGYVYRLMLNRRSSAGTVLATLRRLWPCVTTLLVGGRPVYGRLYDLKEAVFECR